MNEIDHTCPGCKATSRHSSDPAEQPLSCRFCNYPIRLLPPPIASIFGLEYAEREAL